MMKTILLFLPVLVRLHAMTITNITDRPIAVIYEGKVKVKIGVIRMLRQIDLDTIRETIDQVERYYLDLRRLAINDENLRNMGREIKDLKGYLHRIIPKRGARALEFMGKIAKTLYGIPDAQDLKRIDDSLNSLDDRMKHQSGINIQIQDKINEILKIYHDSGSSNSLVDKVQLIQITLNLRAIRDKIKDIQEAVAMSKTKTPNLQLLDHNEIKEVEKILADQNIKINMAEEIGFFLESVIVMKNGKLFIMMKIPKVKKTDYEKLRVFALVNKKQERVVFPGEFYIRKYPTSYRLKGKCEIMGNYQVCSEDDLVDTKGDHCIHAAIFSSPAACETERVIQHDSMIELSPTSVLVNQAKVNMSGNCHHDGDKRFLAGSFIIEYENCTLQLNNRTFVNKIIKGNFLPKFYDLINPKIGKKKLVEELAVDNYNESMRTTNERLKPSLFDWIMRYPVQVAALIVLTMTLLLLCCRR